MPRTIKTKKAPEKKKKETNVRPRREKPKAAVAEEIKVLKMEEGGEMPIVIEDQDRYFEAIGRRKTSIARVRISTKGDKVMIVNDKPLEKYFPTKELQEIAASALNKMKCADKFNTTVKVGGGGIHGQAEAIRHGVSRVLVLFNQDFKKRLKRAGFLTRDPRMRERKKFGLKRARRAPQWQKR